MTAPDLWAEYVTVSNDLEIARAALEIYTFAKEKNDDNKILFDALETIKERQ